ncbi:MAG: class I SAM-dependent methyltransferase [Selenomonas sp.]|uniref:tRNA (mnm(5)s(2)U34)-methyltransferase n=1 Tax=Selenomonas sp. TaxID=2053611 RepID=UPI0025DFBBC5|nr:class I SAM-dependent methyltransferase [Selenomonas sp.]MCR5756966.1 class I SAM-dependent methyltransferase [Selenomonas sp.]
MQTVSNVLNLVKQAILPALQNASLIVDATAGNGNDTLFFAEHSLEKAKIYVFDIQPAALEHTREKTRDFAGKIEYILGSHERIGEMVSGEIDVAMFNLGYLPGEEHVVTTKWESTLAAVRQVLDKLSLNGVCVIVVYPGHEAGAQEAARLEEFLGTLAKKKYTAGRYRLMNHSLSAPYAYVVEKVR